MVATLSGVERRTRKNAATRFNLMVAGHARTGKSAYLETLLGSLALHRLLPVDTVPPSGYRRDSSVLPARSQVPGPKSASTLLPIPGADFMPVATTALVECDDAFGSQTHLMLQLIDCPGLNVPVGIAKCAVSAQLDAFAWQAEAYAKSLLLFVEVCLIFFCLSLTAPQSARKPNSL